MTGLTGLRRRGPVGYAPMDAGLFYRLLAAFAVRLRRRNYQRRPTCPRCGGAFASRDAACVTLGIKHPIQADRNRVGDDGPCATGRPDKVRDAQSALVVDRYDVPAIADDAWSLGKIAVANDIPTDLRHSDRGGGLYPTHLVEHRNAARYPVAPINDYPLCLRLARRFTPQHRQAALQVMRSAGVAYNSALVDDIAHAMGLWAFPSQDDADFALPGYDSVKLAID